MTDLTDHDAVGLSPNFLGQTLLLLFEFHKPYLYEFMGGLTVLCQLDQVLGHTTLPYHDNRLKRVCFSF